MRHRLVGVAWILAAASAALPACADAPAATAAAPPTGQPAADPYANPDPARYLFEDQLKPGMTGYGLTVLRGDKIERFNVEIIDVMRNFEPGRNAILIRCSGLNLEHTGIIAGMSGSPVFINDKMIGAVAFGWGLSKDPIGGVQPIRQMLSIPMRPAGAAPGPQGARGVRPESAFLWQQAQGHEPWQRLLKTIYPTIAQDAAPQLDDDPRALRPLVAPLSVGGGSPEAMAFLQQALAGDGLVPVAAGSAGATLGAGKQLGGAADIAAGTLRLEPGSSLAIPVVTGDLDLSAIGTVTETRGDRVWAFGHSMFGDGPTALPVATGYIYTVLPNLSQSLKLGASYQMQGTLVTDEQTGIVARLGAAPPLIPMQMRVRTTDGRLDHTYHYELAQHPQLTSSLLGTALVQSLTAQRQLPKEYTAHLTGTVTFDDAQLQVNVRATPSQFNLQNILLPVALLTDNPFDNLTLRRVDLEASIDPVMHQAQIDSVSVDRTIAAPGDTLHMTVELVPFQRPTQQVVLALKVPDDAPDGLYQLTVGSADLLLVQEAMVFPQRYDPHDTPELVQSIKRLLAYQNDRLYARLVLQPTGAAEGQQEFPKLPPTRLAMLATAQRPELNPVFAAVDASADAGAVLDTGGDTFRITVAQDADKRFPAPRVRRMLPMLRPLSPNGPAPTRSAPTQPEDPDEP